MSKQAFIAQLILVSLLLVILDAEVAEPNPYEPPPFYPPTPNRDLPTIFVVSPANATYNLNNIALNIFIIQPASWHQGNMTVGYMRDVTYTMDGRTNILWDQMYNPPPTLPQISNFSAQLDNLKTGNHSLLLLVSCYSIYDSHQSVNWHMTETYWFNVTQTVTFAVNASTISSAPTLTPTPSTTHSSSPTPTSTLSPSPSPPVPEFPSFILVSLLMIAVLVGVISYKTKMIKREF